MEAPEFYQNSFCPQFAPEKRQSFDNKSNNGADHFVVEDLFDFSNDDDAIVTDGGFDNVTGNSTDSSTLTVIDSCNSTSFSGYDPNFAGDIGCRNLPDPQFSSDLCVPYDDLAELEWLSNIVEESFSSEDLQKLQLISGMKARGSDEASEENRDFQPESNRNNPIFNSDVSVPAKARSKRSRAPPCNWTSRLLLLSPNSTTTTPPVLSPEPEVFVPAQLPNSTGKKTIKATLKKKEFSNGAASSGEGRKCLHCATDKTPQWRTGPMGPKTLCNACGVRYKSGRLVPEYRPAASPTFVLTKHSNSHRKVMELRRQKEVQRSPQNHHPQHFLHHQQNMIFDVSNGEDYLIHQHVGPDFRQLI
ncbi:hypothetical protein UlMin_034871 [Ulmus minor]